MSGLTPFPHSHGGHFAVASPRWESIDFESSSPTGHDAQSVKKCIDLAYASVIYQYTGDATIRFLNLDLSGNEETWAIKHVKFDFAEDRHTNDLQCKIEAFTLPEIGLEAPNLLIYDQRDALLVGAVTPKDGVALNLVYSVIDSAFARFRFSYNARVVTQFHAQGIKATFLKNLTMFTTHQSRISHSDLEQIREEDIEWIKQWNSTAQTLGYRTIHDCISETAARDPSRAAIEAHDGHLTRGKLATLSQATALRLSEANIAPGNVVAIVMDKSQWVVVTILAVLRLGAAFLLLDPSLPVQRMKAMTEKVRATHTVTTIEHGNTSAMLTDRVLVHMGYGRFLELDRPAETSPAENRGLPKVSPENVAFYIFTSGSSGIPKAISTQHFAWSTGYTHRVPNSFGICEGTRVFQYASYSFVVSILDMISTLMVGGIVCIPGAHERANDLDGAIRRFSPQYLCLTPSVAKVLDPARLPSLKTLVLVGEPIPSALVQNWLNTGKVRILNGYGQSEACSMNSTVELAHDPLTHSSIGRSTWLRYWVVDPSDHDRLMPIGAVGELVVEGRSIAQGYYGEPQRTAKVFIERPKWADIFDIPRECRYYKTGDLVQWQADGSLLLFGRNDAQVKFHGMRVQVGEVEHHIAHAFKEEISETVVEKVILQHDGGEREHLVAFVVERAKQGSKGRAKDQVQDLRRQESAKSLQQQMQSRLAQDLPQWMIPSEVMIVDAMPRTATGKLHRSILRESYAAHERNAAASLADVQDQTSSSQAQAIADPKFDVMRSIWAKIGRVNGNKIAAQSRWTDIGGDSLTAIPLVRESRLAGFSLTTAQIMSGLTLLDASKKMAEIDQTLQQDAVQAQDQSDHGPELYALTDFQKVYLPKPGKKSWTYDYEVTLRGDFDLSRLRSAVDTLIKRTEALRIRIVPDPAGDLKQTVLSANDVSLKARILDKSAPFQQNVLTEPVVFRIGEQVENASRDVTFSLHMHHAIFDGISLHLILDDLVSAYVHGDVLSARPGFTRYLDSYLLRRSQDSYDYWRELLAGSKPSPYLRRPIEIADQTSEQKGPMPNEYQFEQILNLDQANNDAVHPASVIAQTAWALTLSCITRDTDVIFCYLLHGRDENTLATERIIGCCVTEVPLRVKLDTSMTGKGLLDQVQQLVHSSMPHSHLGSRTIAESCTDWPQREGWYHYRSYFLHQSVPEVASVPVGDLGYLHVESSAVGRFMLIDFDITTASAGPKELHFDLRVRKDMYSLEDGKAIEAAFAKAVHIVVDGTSTVGQIRDELLTKYRIPVLWQDEAR